MPTPQEDFADAIRAVTTAAQTAWEQGHRAAQVDLHDITELLLSIADRLDPPLPPRKSGCAFCRKRANRPRQGLTCPYCETVWPGK